MSHTLSKTEKRQRRHKRIRAKTFGTAERPRLLVFKSNRSISAQLINDEKGETLAAGMFRAGNGVSLSKGAAGVGKEVARQALVKRITRAVFDRGGYKYTGSVQELARGAREGGLQF